MQAEMCSLVTKKCSDCVRHSKLDAAIAGIRSKAISLRKNGEMCWAYKVIVFKISITSNRRPDMAQQLALAPDDDDVTSFSHSTLVE